jgi:hypothetical protein
MPGPTLEPLQTAADGAAVGDVAAAGAPRAEAAINATMRRPFTPKRTARGTEGYVEVPESPRKAELVRKPESGTEL